MYNDFTKATNLIYEEKDEDELCDVSEGLIVPHTPITKNVRNGKRKEDISKVTGSNSNSGLHTRTNSSKA